MPRIRAAALLCAAALALSMAGCAQPQRTYGTGVLAADQKLMPKAELIRYQDRLEDELARTLAGGAVPAGVSREEYAADLRQRMKDVQHEIGLRNIWERKAYWERMDLLYGR